MKILTNIRFYRVAGIAQTLLSWLDYIKRHEKNINVVGVDIHKRGEPRSKIPPRLGRMFTLASPTISYKKLDEVVRRARSVDDIRLAYQDVINAYADLISETKPDAILINGTFVLPWCLFLAAQKFSIPTVLHYHGILSREVPHWPPERQALVRDMEKLLYADNVKYVFPSVLAKNEVENKIWQRSATGSLILRNPILESFFNEREVGRRNDIGLVTRWTAVKNFKFIEALARYNRVHGRLWRINIVTDLKRNARPRQKLRALVKFKNTMENKSLPRFYRKMKVVLCPSLFETYGNVAQEALACGTPALVNKNMGVSELYQELGLEKWIINFDSPEAVMAKIQEASQARVEPAVEDKLKILCQAEKIYGELVNYLRLILLLGFGWSAELPI